VRLHFIGSGDAFGSGGRFQTCFWLEGEASGSLLIDCGTTTLTALKAARIEPNEIAAVALTHLHGDHFGGLPFLVLDGQFRRRQQRLTIAGPPGTQQRVEAAMELLFAGSVAAKRRFELEFIELTGAARPVGPALVSAVPVEQPDTPACALKVEYGGRVIAYTGDTAWGDHLVELAAGADLLIGEAYFFDRQVPYHLDYATLHANRDRLNCERIVLTHMSPNMLARQSDADFPCAHDGMVVTL
jgi:ribonuclease BN (tRNA processing enzyme)